MKLRDLDAQFLHAEVGGDAKFNRYVDTLAEANGIMFTCPKCLEANKGSNVGVHSVICWFTGVPQDWSPKPGRWNAQGTGLNDLTFVPPGAVSVQLIGGCEWHGFVKDGSAS